MKNKIVKWLVTNIIVPLFREILVDFGKSILKFLLDLFKSKMHKWKSDEEEKAQNEDEKIIIRKKWDDRMDDIESMKDRVDKNIDKIVKDSLERSETKIEEIKNSSVNKPRIDEKTSK